MATELARGRHWVYLDQERTHEVHALVEPRVPDLLFSTTEFPAGSREPNEALTEERVLSTTDQLRLALFDLESRLAVSGTYYRADVADMKWSLVAPPPAARKLDLRAHEIALPGAAPGAKMGVHHFHASSDARDRLLVTLPRDDVSGRSVLAQLDFDFPHVNDGDLSVLHPRLAPGTLRSQLARQHLTLPTQGFAKLVEPRDYEKAFGSNWIERTRETFRLAAVRVLSWGKEEPKAPEVPLLAPGDAELEAALRHPKIAGIRSRWIAADDAARLLAGGELGIRRFIQQRRRKADHHQTYDLSVLEAALLVEYGLRYDARPLLAEEGGRLLRFATPARQ